mmetsp:Transcript_11010/g.26588  ORF Transcript_11010/g.26588 Transcript_11010/m.26588 type:complete len:217 (+) Transcript_11010:980-1630(+)
MCLNSAANAVTHLGGGGPALLKSGKLPSAILLDSAGSHSVGKLSSGVAGSSPSCGRSGAAKSASSGLPSASIPPGITSLAAGGWATGFRLAGTSEASAAGSRTSGGVTGAGPESTCGSSAVVFFGRPRFRGTEASLRTAARGTLPSSLSFAFAACFSSLRFWFLLVLLRASLALSRTRLASARFASFLDCRTCSWTTSAWSGDGSWLETIIAQMVS